MDNQHLKGGEIAVWDEKKKERWADVEMLKKYYMKDIFIQGEISSAPISLKLKKELTCMCQPAAREVIYIHREREEERTKHTRVQCFPV